MPNLIKTKLRIYESYDNGYITEEDKNNMLDILDKVVTERIETNILDKVGFKTKYTLYHASSRDLDIIKANSLNIGTRLSGMRTSSFWGKERDVAVLFGIYQFLASVGIPFAVRLQDNKAYILDTEYKYKDRPNVVMTSEKILSTCYKNGDGRSPIYVYTLKDVPIKEVGKGQVNIGEYTLDINKKPDKKEKLSWGDIFKYMVFVKPDSFWDIKDDTGGSRKTLSEKLLYKDPDKVFRKRMKEYIKAKEEGRFDPSTSTITLKNKK